MDQSEPSGSGETNDKRRKENSENDQNVEDDADNAVNQVCQQTADILKMDIDCCEEAFDYLPLEDLISIGKTCKRMQQVAGHCFQQSYSGKIVSISDNGIYSEMKSSHRTRYNVGHFASFIENIWIEDVSSFRYFCKVRSDLRRLKQIDIRGLKSTDMDRMKNISMGKLENLSIVWCELNHDFDEVIGQCVELKRLNILGCRGKLNWLNRKYPTLEHFVFVSFENDPIEDNSTFLELNPNIQKFEINAKFLWNHRDAMMAANIKLDVLGVFFGSNGLVEFNAMCDLLDELYARGFYKKLEFNFLRKYNQEEIDRLASLNGLNKLFLRVIIENSTILSALNNLEELHVWDHSIADINELPNSLVKLKSMLLWEISIDIIVPFIRRSVETQKITVGILKGGVYFNEDTGIIDLPALNREREQLPDAQKITLYVNEWIYLATKWANRDIDFKFIGLRRLTLF